MKEFDRLFAILPDLSGVVEVMYVDKATIDKALEKCPEIVGIPVMFCGDRIFPKPEKGIIIAGEIGTIPDHNRY
jgi:hypothetical protein